MADIRYTMGFFELLVRLLAPLIDFVAVRFRPLAMVLVVMPLSFVLRKFLNMRERLATRKWPEGLEEHNKRVRRVKVCIASLLNRSLRFTVACHTATPTEMNEED